MMRIALVWLTLFLVACVGEARYFSQAELVRHFQQNRNSFDELVNDWQAKKLNGRFSYDRIEHETVWWNYVVIFTNQQAGHIAEPEGISLEKLQELLATAKKLEITEVSTIGQKLPENQRYLELWFRGAERGPYGLIYVPIDNEARYQGFLAETNATSWHYKKIQFLGGRWFYFEKSL